MICHWTAKHSRACLRSITGLLLTIGAACSGDQTSPTAETTVPADSTLATPSDTAVATPSDSSLFIPPDTLLIAPDSLLPGEASPVATSLAPGIMFGTFDIPTSLLGTLHTGTLRPVDPSTLLSMLSGIRAKGGRIVLKLTKGSSDWLRNADGTFSLTKWKALVDRFKGIDFSSYLADGTIVGHYLIDEPNHNTRWGPGGISRAQVEAMAKYSKQLWPTMTTLVRVVPSWLSAAPATTYTYLDGAWAQYTASKGDPVKWLAAEVTAAKSEGLGLVVSMNVLDGGNGSSGILGLTSGKYSMSAAELKSYGSALLANPYACAFMMWTYNATYHGRSDIKSSMADLASKAKAHIKTSCR